MTAAGYRAVVAAPWSKLHSWAQIAAVCSPFPRYLNYIVYGTGWQTYYQTDPTAFNGTAQQKQLVRRLFPCCVYVCVCDYSVCSVLHVCLAHRNRSLVVNAVSGVLDSVALPHSLTHTLSYACVHRSRRRVHRRHQRPPDRMAARLRHL